MWNKQSFAMQNRLTNIFHRQQQSSSGNFWQVDENPNFRLFWLFVSIAFPLFVVAMRLAYIQFVVAETFDLDYSVEHVSYERVPSRDGRILSADGSVFAEDLSQYDVFAHYRWLEKDPQKFWLKRQAYTQLSLRERKDQKLVKKQQKRILETRSRMWKSLAQFTGYTQEDVNATRWKVQQRVEKLKHLVEQRRKDRDNRHDETKDSDDLSPLENLWDTLIDELTHPPQRLSQEPVVIKEELAYHKLLENIPVEAAMRIEAQQERFPGLKIVISTRRRYPQRTTASHLIGARQPISNSRLEKRKTQFAGHDPLNYREGDRIGISGIEKYYDGKIRGVPGLKKIVRNRFGEIVRTEIVRSPKPGSEIVLSIDNSLQQDFEAILDEVVPPQLSGESESTGSVRNGGGAMVAMDVHTGAILAAASAPRFDLQLFTDFDQKKWQRLLDDPRQPFFSRVNQMSLPPGSVFKTLVSVALLESGKIDPAADFFCQGYLNSPKSHRCMIYRNYGYGHGATDFTTALCRSCNVYFFHSSLQLAKTPRESAWVILDWAKRFAFGARTGIDLPHEETGNLPTPNKRRDIDGTIRTVSHNTGESNSWSKGDTLGLAIGQMRLTVTPLQIVRLMAAISNDGYLVTPHLVRRLETPEGEKFRREIPTVDRFRISGLKQSTRDLIQQGLIKVVNNSQGTGYKWVRMDDVTIAGKSGSAEVGGGKKDHAWFAGYVPAEKPKIAFTVILEHAGSGGKNAGPLAKKLVQALKKHGYIR